MSPAGGDDGGIPRERRRVTLPSRNTSTAEDWTGANKAKADKLRRNNLQRLARTRGLELRHTAYGYALIDAARKRIDDRNDLTLDDVESWLGRSGNTRTRDAAESVLGRGRRV